MTIIPFLNEDLETPLAIAQRLSKQFALTAIERDYSGGTPKLERDQIRESGLLSLIIPKEFNVSHSLFVFKTRTMGMFV